MKRKVKLTNQKERGKGNERDRGLVKVMESIVTESWKSEGDRKRGGKGQGNEK